VNILVITKKKEKEEKEEIWETLVNAILMWSILQLITFKSVT